MRNDSLFTLFVKLVCVFFLLAAHGFPLNISKFDWPGLISVLSRLYLWGKHTIHRAVAGVEELHTAPEKKQKTREAYCLIERKEVKFEESWIIHQDVSLETPAPFFLFFAGQTWREKNIRRTSEGVNRLNRGCVRCRNLPKERSE